MPRQQPQQDQVRTAPVGTDEAPPERLSLAVAKTAEKAVDRGAEVDYAKVFENPVALEHYQNIARIFASSMFVPSHFRGKVADCLIALNLAVRMGEDALAVMQQTFVVGGSVGFETAFMIARFNRYRKQVGFSSRIRWEVVTLEPATIEVRGKKLENLRVVAYALDEDGERVEGTPVSMKMAIAEDWVKNPKYLSMPEHMLKFRAAAFLIRQTAPEILMGIPLVEELVDVGAAAGRPVVVGESKTASLLQKLAEQAEGEAVEREAEEAARSAEEDAAGASEDGEELEAGEDVESGAPGDDAAAETVDEGEEAAEPVRTMSADQVERVRAECRKLGVPVGDVEGYFVEKLADVTVDDGDGDAAFAKALDVVRKLAREASSTTRGRKA